MSRLYCQLGAAEATREQRLASIEEDFAEEPLSEPPLPQVTDWGRPRTRSTQATAVRGRDARWRLAWQGEHLVRMGDEIMWTDV